MIIQSQRQHLPFLRMGGKVMVDLEDDDNNGSQHKSMDLSLHEEEGDEELLSVIKTLFCAEIL